MKCSSSNHGGINLFPIVVVSLWAIALFASPLAFGIDLLSQTRGSTVEILQYQYDKTLEKSVEKPIGIGVVTFSMSTPYPASWILTTAESVGASEIVHISFRGKVFVAEVQYIDPQADIAKLRVPNISIDSVRPSDVSAKVGATVNFLTLEKDGYRIQEERIIAISDSSNPPSLTTSRSTTLLSGSGAFDNNGRLVGIATSRFGLRNDGQVLQTVLNTRYQSEIDKVTRAGFRLDVATAGGEFGNVATALAGSSLFVHRWLRETPGKKGKPIYEDILQVIESEGENKTENLVAAAASVQERLIPYVLQFLAANGVQSKVAVVKSKQAESTLNCVLSRPDSFRGQIATIQFSESSNFFSFQGRRADSVAFQPTVIIAYENDGTTTTIDRASGRFSVNQKGNPMFSGDCEIGGKPKF